MIIAAMSTRKKLTWMPSVFETKSDTSTWMPLSPPMPVKWSDASQPIVYAPIA